MPDTNQKKRITKDIILIIVVMAGVASFFYNPQGVNMEFLRTIMGAIVGYYIGLKEFPVFGIRK